MTLPRAVGTPSEATAVFDFDGTITYADSLLPFLRETFGLRRFLGGGIGLAPVFLGHALGWIEAGEAKSRVLRRFFRGWTLEAMHEAGVRFAASGRLRRLWNPRALERVAWHREQGHRLIVLSASLEVYLVPSSEMIGIGEVIGTQIDVIDGRFTGRLSGENCRGEAKLARLQKYLGAGMDGELYAYGDAREDWFVLQKAAHAHYRSFDRDKGLRRKFAAALALLKAIL